MAPLGRIARVDEVSAFEHAAGEPGVDLVAVVGIVRGLALAEHQPRRACLGARDRAGLQVRAQAGQPGAVADQDQGPPCVVTEPERAMRSQAQGDLATQRQPFGEPARRHAQRAVGVAFLPHQQVHAAIGVQRSDRVLARPLGNAGGQHLHQITRLPAAERAAGRRFEFEVEARPALAARVQVTAHHQAPRLERAGLWRRRQVARASDARELVVPLLQRGGIALVDLDALEQRGRAALAQPAVERAAVAAVVPVAAVAQREHAAVQVLERQRTRRRHHAPHEGGGRVRWIAFAIGADDEERALGAAQVLGPQLRQAAQPRRHAGGMQRLGGPPGQLLGGTGLAGVQHQHRRRAVGGRGQRSAGTLGQRPAHPLPPPGGAAQAEVGQHDDARCDLAQRVHRQHQADLVMPAAPRTARSGAPRAPRHRGE